MTGIVRMTPASTGGWRIELPDGSTNLNINGTTTQGLWEALNYAIANGWNFECEGAPTNNSGISRGLITCSTGLVFPPLNGIKIKIDADINFTQAVNGNGIIFDSLQNCRIEFNGYVYYGGSFHQVLFKPVNNVPNGPIGICKNTIKFHDLIVYQATGHTPICNIAFDITSSNAVIVQNKFNFSELKVEGATANSLAPYNLIVWGHVSASVFRYNQIRVGAALGAGIYSIYINNMLDSGDNTWFLNGLNPIGTVTSHAPGGLYSDNNNDTFYLGVISASEGAFDTGITFGSNSSHNMVIGGRCFGQYGAPSIDVGVGNKFVWTHEITGSGASAGVTSLNGHTGALTIEPSLSIT